MKKVFTVIILFCFVSLKLSAQISIVSSDMPASGDTLRFSTANIDADVLALYTKTGANQTWDFSFIEAVSSDIEEYKGAMQTPYGFFFFGSFGLKMADTIGYGSYSITNVYNFFKNSSSKFEANGMGLSFNGMPVPAWYKDNDEIYQFPLNYQRRDSSTFYFNVGLSTMLEYSTAGYRINEVDGWGEITTPYGTFDCIRVKTTIISADSVGIQGFKFGFPNERMEYKWLAKNVKFPVLEVSGNIMMGSFTPTSLRYRDHYRLIINPLAPVADFEASNLTPSTIDTVRFANNTTGFNVSYQWTITPSDFVYLNGTDNTSRNPEVRFTKEGLYSVSLDASNFFGTNKMSKTDYIDVSKNTKNLPLADFSYDIAVPNTAHEVSFSDLSTVYATSTYLWIFAPATVSFKSGTTAASKEPVVTFVNPNTYNVTLKVENVFGSDEVTKSINVVSTSLAESKEPAMVLYPNPAKNGRSTVFLSNMEIDNGIITVRDLSGRLLLTKEITSLTHDTPLSIDFYSEGLKAGMYIMELSSKEKHFIRSLFVD